MQENARQAPAPAQPSKPTPKDLIVIVVPIAGLGYFIYDKLGIHWLGTVLIAFGMVIVVIYLFSWTSQILRNAFVSTGSVLRELIKVVVRPLKSAGPTLGKLVYAVALLYVFFYILTATSVLSIFVLTEQQQKAFAYLKVADACLARDDYVCALDQAEKARELLPDDLRVDEAVLRSKILKLTVEDLFFHDASEAEIDNVDRSYEFLVNRRPAPSLLGLKGIIFSLRDNPTAADEQFQKATNADPDNPNVHNYWGFEMMLWQVKNNWQDQSRHEFERAKMLNKKYATPLINLALLLQIEQPPSESVFKQEEQLLLQAKAADPDSQRVLLSLGSLYTNWGIWLQHSGAREDALKKYVKAQEELESAYSINPKNPFLLTRLGLLILAMDGDAERAIQRFKDALAERPDYVEAHEGLAHAYMKAKKPSEALAAFKQALASASKVNGLLRTRGLRAITSEAKGQLETWQQGEQKIMKRLQEQIDHLSRPAPAAKG